MASSSVSTSAAAASAPATKPRKHSNASSSMESETGRIRLNSIGSIGSVLADVGTGLTPPKVATLPAPPSHHTDNQSLDDDAIFQIPASVPQHDSKNAASRKASNASEDSKIRVATARASLPQLSHVEESGSLTSSKNSRNLPAKKRKMSYESYDSAMNDSYLGLAPLDNSFIRKQLKPDSGSVATRGSGASASERSQLKLAGVSALDHLDALGDHHADLPPPAPVNLKRPPEPDFKQKHPEVDEHSSADETFTSSGHRLLMEAIMMTGGNLEGGGQRKRFESWGGMSDLSAPVGSDQAAAIAASALHHTGIFEDVTAAANFGGGSVDSSVTDDHLRQHAEAPIIGRERKESTTSFSDNTFPVPSSLDGMEISSDLQKFVSAAVASVGDQLAELAGNIESAAAAVHVDGLQQDDNTRAGSEVSSIATPLALGSSLDDPMRPTIGKQSLVKTGKSDQSDTRNTADAAAASAISVDYDAVAAAVDAANGLDLSAFADGSFTANLPRKIATTASKSKLSGGARKAKGRRKLPTHGKKSKNATSNPYPAVSIPVHGLGDVPKSSLSEKEQEEIRERARKAAGYVPPSQLSLDSTTTPAKNRILPPLKKRLKRATPEPGTTKSDSHITPKISNTSNRTGGGASSAAVPSSVPSSSRPGSKEKSTAKWEGMFAALLEFRQERMAEETAGMSEEEIADWSWDGNVPTTYKTKDGKALGRWINNQRSAKSKGTLKGEREKRLVDAGLKWSVLASNSWNEMLEELRIYIKEYTKDGKTWDGNVPTNYKIKTRTNGRKMTEEDKNLGRWVNRQRSLYQSGKLRKDRQLALEKVGLKWSMLATTSWDSMFETLVDYVEAKKTRGIEWDGNVPANFKTDDNPPRALGRWINRQRSAHVKKKLKKEYVDKLSELGLKWSVHERKSGETTYEPNAGADAVVSSGLIPATIAVPAAKVEQNLRGPHDDIHKPDSVQSVPPLNTPSNPHLQAQSTEDLAAAETALREHLTSARVDIPAIQLAPGAGAGEIDSKVGELPEGVSGGNDFVTLADKVAATNESEEKTRDGATQPQEIAGEIGAGKKYPSPQEKADEAAEIDGGGMRSAATNKQQGDENGVNAQEEAIEEIAAGKKSLASSDEQQEDGTGVNAQKCSDVVHHQQEWASAAIVKSSVCHKRSSLPEELPQDPSPGLETSRFRVSADGNATPDIEPERGLCDAAGKENSDGTTSPHENRVIPSDETKDKPDDRPRINQNDDCDN